MFDKQKNTKPKQHRSDNFMIVWNYTNTNHLPNVLLFKWFFILSKNNFITEKIQKNVENFQHCEVFFLLT